MTNARQALKKRIFKIVYFGSSSGAHVTRYSMYHSLSALNLDNNNGQGMKLLSISHSSNLIRTLELEKCEIFEANYPDYNITDLHAFSDNEFDYVVSDQVLEHIEGDPRMAFSESHRILKSGGVAIHTTCFMNPIHRSPGDYWRFTPDGLRYLAKDFSEIIDAGGWGNRAVWLLDALGMRFWPIPHAKWHPLHRIAVRNNELWPVVTWIVARK